MKIAEYLIKVFCWITLFAVLSLPVVFLLWLGPGLTALVVIAALFFAWML